MRRAACLMDRPSSSRACLSATLTRDDTFLSDLTPLPVAECDAVVLRFDTMGSLSGGGLCRLGWLLGIDRWFVPPLGLDPLSGEGERLLSELRKSLPPGQPAQVGLGDFGLLRQLALLHPVQQGAKGLGSAVISHEGEGMPASIECQLTFDGPGLAKRHTDREDHSVQGVQRRGTGERDPVQVRAISRLNEVINERGLTSTEVADLSGFKQGHVYKILAGEQKETAFWVIARIAGALGVSLDWLAEPPRAAKPATDPPPAHEAPKPATEPPAKTG